MMANKLQNPTLAEKGLIHDISGLPTDIQRIPHHILKMFGIIVENTESQDKEDDILIIDENPPEVRVEISQVSSKNQEQPAKPDVPTHIKAFEPQAYQIIVTEKKYKSTRTKVYYPDSSGKTGHRDNSSEFKTNQSLPDPLSSTKKKKTAKEIKSKQLNVAFCGVCNKLVSEVSSCDHSKYKCPQKGCTELILDEVDRLRHKKMHDHPTKPFACRFCKKRYSFAHYVEKHYTYCKNTDKSKVLS